jgi:murein DD-endopeptidase MepM/ murein hydrolase activator NlpD
VAVLVVRMAGFVRLIGIVCLCWCLPVLADSAIYRYQDPSGRWVFSDKKPVKGIKYYQMSYGTSGNSASVSSRHSGTVATPEPGLNVALQTLAGKTVLGVENPFYAPVEVRITFDSGRAAVQQVVPARGKLAVPDLRDQDKAYHYQWKLGDPGALADQYVYHAPLAKSGTYQISQGFNGGFSHNRPGNRYAIDIPASIGTDIAAARAGVVVQVQDQYQSGGVSKLLRSKTNYLTLLHEDGTFGIYLHILANSVRLKPGDAVVAGQVIARSGNSGYSTGPHLHFAVRRNAGMEVVAIPFRMKDTAGKLVRLERGSTFNVGQTLLSSNP